MVERVIPTCEASTARARARYGRCRRGTGGSSRTARAPRRSEPGRADAPPARMPRGHPWLRARAREPGARSSPRAVMTRSRRPTPASTGTAGQLRMSVREQCPLHADDRVGGEVVGEGDRCLHRVDVSDDLRGIAARLLTDLRFRDRSRSAGEVLDLRAGRRLAAEQDRAERRRHATHLGVEAGQLRGGVDDDADELR